MNKKKQQNLEKIARALRYDVLTSTTKADSGHPTSCLSAVELMTVLFFAGFLKQDTKNFKNIFNDRVIFSKGHAAPLLYSLYHRAGVISQNLLLSLRQFQSPLQGHPLPDKNLGFIDVATGSLGQGLSIALGMALGLRLKFKQLKINQVFLPHIFVLLGDSEIAEGENYEAMNLASYYQVNNLIAIVDVNRLGQRGETMAGWKLTFYQKKFSAFGWQTFVINDGHNLEEIFLTFKKIARLKTNQPMAIIAKTIKGKGVSLLENQENWHGKTLSKSQLNQALKELGKIDLGIKEEIKKPTKSITLSQPEIDEKIKKILLKLEEKTSFLINNNQDLKTVFYSTREAYGDALVELGKENQNLVVLDAETGNSTYAQKFKNVYPERFFEMFIAEQNMISVAVGLSKVGFIPFASSFAAFLTRAFDQIRMAQYSDSNLKICGSHSGVSIGPDGPSQMGLEDIAMMKSILTSVVFYPSDAISTKKLVKIAFTNRGIFYLRTTREKTPIVYQENDEFFIGGSKIHYSSIKGKTDQCALIVTAGITLFEALAAQKELEKKNIDIVIVDAYSVKPIDDLTIKQLAKNYPHIIVLEDHYPYGGLKESVIDCLKNHKTASFHHLAVFKIPSSGKKEELFSFEKIDKQAIINKIKSIFN